MMRDTNIEPTNPGDLKKKKTSGQQTQTNASVTFEFWDKVRRRAKKLDTN